MKPLILLLLILFQELPYKPKEQFEIKSDYQFRQRPALDDREIRFDETRQEYERRTETGLLPHLTLNVKMLSLENESRVKITNNLNKMETTKKLKEGIVIPVVLGFTDDVKDRVNPHLYTLTFMSNERKDLSKIVIMVEEDGTFLVNGEKRGRF